ncbi:MAG: cell division protein ZapE [Burkholderiaceae bacterium]|nr:MAG: cell division protein ZapE [Burkholderiaceae bacterium]
MTVTELYRQHLQQRGYQSDSAQLRAIERLQQCEDEWRGYKEQRSTKLRRLVLYPDLPQGVYLWGGVGRGKSFLMDSFYLAVPLIKKTRMHFHEFMREVHRQLDELKGTADPLEQVAERIADKYRLICFDEFHVSDIADAMILYRLLDALFRNRVSLVMTSNYPPHGLYPDGLHRDRLLPAIALIQQHLAVVNVDAGVDYRQRTLAHVQTYHMPLDDTAQAALTQAFELLAEAEDESPLLMIETRQIHALRRAGGVVWFSFAEIFEGPRSQNDYLEIASQFHTVIVSGVPQMSAGMASAARRFTWLVDIFYDHKIKLILSAAVKADELYLAGVLANEFQRTVSRLVEMQSQEYLNAPRTAVAQF